MFKFEKKYKNLSILIIPITVAIFNILIILFPRDIIDASKNGLNLWFNNVLPSLLPFIIGTNILAGLGAISFIGTLLGPIMYPLFGVSGSGSFALVTGMTSGYPMGAKVVSMLRENDDITQIDAQRLISFVNNSGPLFILGAVGVGMFKNINVGYFLMTSHYISAILTGLIFKYYKRNEDKKIITTKKIFSRALRNMRATRAKDGKTFGTILADSVRSSMETIALIGGFIILFCVIVKALEITGVIGLTEKMLQNVLIHTNITGDRYKGLFIGLIEVTNGTKILANESFSSIDVLLCLAIISFGGFSIHAQTISFISKVDIKISLYFISKFIHSLLSIVVGLIILPFFDLNSSHPVFFSYMSYGNSLTEKLGVSSLFFLFSISFIIFFIILIIVLNFIHKLYLNLHRTNCVPTFFKRKSGKRSGRRTAFSFL